jgi:DNA-directed RNA polymerase specialized sigma24 family protein
VRRVDEDEYRSYVMAWMDRLQRAAYLLCRDWHTAEDLVSRTSGKLYRNWSRAQQTRHQPRPTAPGIQSNPLQTPQP